MKEKRIEQSCMATRVLWNGNWENYMWPHQIDKLPRLDPELLSFLHQLNLSHLTPSDQYGGSLAVRERRAKRSRH